MYMCIYIYIHIYISGFGYKFTNYDFKHIPCHSAT